MKSVLIWRYQMFKPSEHFILNQAQRLKEFVPVLVGGKHFGEPQYPVAHKCLQSTRASFLLGQSAEFEHLLTENAPDLVHSHFCVDASLLLGVLRKRDLPLVVTCHGFDTSVRRMQMLCSGKIPWMWHALNERRLAKRADAFICVSDFIRRKMAERGYPEGKLLTHYIGIDTEHIRPDEQVRKFEHPTVFAVARFTEKKGLRFLIEAFKGVRARCVDAQLLIAGDGALKLELERQIVESGLENCVKLLGMLPHSEVLNVMQQAWCVCVPSVTASNGDSEGLPTVVLEAFALTVPVVATHHGGIPEVITEGANGYLVPEWNVGQLAERLLYVLENRSVREALGTQARKHVEEHFNIRRKTQSLEEIYRGVL